MGEIENKVATSGLVTIDLEDLYESGDRVTFDIRPFLYQDLLLKEKEFREALKKHPWSDYSGKLVGVICSSEAIVPTWAYMLISLELQPFAKRIFFASDREMDLILFREKLAAMDPKTYAGARVVIKGCSDKPVPVDAFVELTRLLKPHVKSIMYGEPCSTVPLYKSKS